MLTRREALLSASSLSALWATRVFAQLSSTGAGILPAGAPAAPAAWSELLVGPGGNVQGIATADDGTMAVYCDTYGAYIGRPSTMVGAGGTGKWSLLATTNSLPAGFVGVANSLRTDGAKPNGVWDVGFAPSNSSVICLVAMGYVFVSTNKGLSFLLTNVAQDPTMFSNGAPLRLPSVAIDPQRPDTMFVGTSQNGLWTTSNALNGSGGAWCQIPLASIPISSTVVGGAGITLVKFDRSSPIVGGTTQGLYVYVYGQGLFHSVDGGISFSFIAGSPSNATAMEVSKDGYVYLIENGYTPGPISVYVFNGSTGSTVAAGPATNGANGISSDPGVTGRVVMVGFGGDLNISSNHGAVWSGFINGTFGSWYTATDVPWLGQLNAISGGVTTNAGVFDPSQSNVMVVPQGIGCAFGSPGATPHPTWTSISKGIEQLVANDMCCPPSGTPIVASWDRPLITTNGFTAATFPSTFFPVSPTVAFGTRGYYVDYASDASGVVIASSWVYTGTTGPGFKSTDNGATWSAFASQPVTSLGCPIAATTNLAWILLDPVSQTIYYTANGGSSWAAATGAPTSGWSQINFGSGTFPLAADKSNGDFYAWHSTGFFRSTNGGATWSNVLVSALPTVSGRVRVKTIKGAAGNIVVTSNGGALFLSTDAGIHWSQPNTNVSQVFAFDSGTTRSGKSHPSMYLSGFLSGVYGIYRSDDLAVTWTLLTDSVWGEWPIGNMDFVTAMCASPDTDGYVGIGFVGSGYAQGFFP